jgi:CheY-like chemotaxis protein
MFTDEIENSKDPTKYEESILIAEDEETNYLFLAELLSDKKYKILHARNGEEAIKLCNDNKDIVLILMDLKMPILDGFEATKEIKKIMPDVKIIAQTAYAMKNDKEKAIQSGCDDYISKPIDIRIFKEMLSKYLPA